jgi:hypothetical protein
MTRRVELTRDRQTDDNEVLIIQERLAFELALSQLQTDAAVRAEERKAQIETARDRYIHEFNTTQFTTNNSSSNSNLLIPESSLMEYRIKVADFEEQIRQETQRIAMQLDKTVTSERERFGKIENFRKNELNNKIAESTIQINNIQKELVLKIRALESDWQSRALKWQAIAKRKIDALKKEQQEKASKSRKQKNKS